MGVTKMILETEVSYASHNAGEHAIMYSIDR